MTVPSEESRGADVLALEIREEAGRLVHHPIAEARRLEHVAAEGESPATLIVLIAGTIVAAVVVGGAAIAVALAVYYSA